MPETMKLPWRRGETPRGQALVEFAVILPVLALLLVMAVDFGRVFYGWVALQNATRIGANEVAFNPDAWTGTGDAALQAEYRRLVMRDMERINCMPPSGPTWQESDIPDPTFADVAGTATTDPYDIGDHASVSLDCRFSLLTPMAGAILGDPVQITARADFAIRGGIIAGVPIGPTPPPNPDTCTKALVPNLVGKTVADARATWSNAGFTGSFSPNSSADDTDIVTSQTTNPVAYPGDCVDATTSVSVQHEPEADCPSGEEHVPNVIGDTLATARSKWTAAGFTGSFLPSTGYDSDLVTTQATSTGKGPGECSVLSTLITVGHSSPQTFCTAPDLSGLTANAAQTSFQAAGFAGTFKSQGPSTGTVSGQSLVAGQPYLCSSGITVTLKK